jgi:glycosyltransferase involved in cell wall biosynthesis
MRIGIISDLWLNFPGGAERYVANVAQALLDRDHEIHVLTSYAPAVAAHCTTMTIIDIGVNSRRAEGAVVIKNWITAGSFDLLITHHYFAGVFADEIFNRGSCGCDGIKAIPIVEIIHNRQRNWKAALAIFNSEYTAVRCGRQEKDMVMLPPAGVDCVIKCICGWQESKGQRTSIFCPRCDISHKYIGHIKPLGGKGIALTYQLAVLMPDRKFLILRGEWQDGEDIRSLPNVSFMEPVGDIREFYAKCRLVLMPSLSEDAGTVPQECALNGIPCISSNVGGLPETNGGGIVLPPDCVSDWIIEICKLDHPEYYREIAERQKTFIMSQNWDKQFDELDRRIKEIVK